MAASLPDTALATLSNIFRPILPVLPILSILPDALPADEVILQPILLLVVIFARKFVRLGLVDPVLRPLLDLDDRGGGRLVGGRSPVCREVKERPAVRLPIGVAVPRKPCSVEDGRVDLPLRPVLDVDVGRPNWNEIENHVLFL